MQMPPVGRVHIRAAALGVDADEFNRFAPTAGIGAERQVTARLADGETKLEAIGSIGRHGAPAIFSEHHDLEAELAARRDVDGRHRMHR